MRLLSLFSGIGGLDAAVEAALGAQVVAHCEADAYCRQILARHWPGVPCFDDVQTLTAEQVGAIDCICGGFPCTDLSVAGKQAGIHAERSGLWWEYLRLVRELRPAMVVVENVPPLYRTPAWREAVEGSLDALGYRMAWTLCQASDVGAPHKRERTFALAVRADVAWPAGGCTTAPSSAAATAACWPTPVARDANGSACGALEGSPSLGHAIQWPTPTSNGNHNRTGVSPTAGDGLGWDFDRPHSPQLPEQVGGTLSPSWVECLMGLPPGWTAADGDAQTVDLAPRWPAGRVPGLDGASPQHDWEPPRLVAPKTVPKRTSRLKALGNAVVPQQALFALSRLLAAAHDPTRDPMGSAQGVLL